LFYLPDLTQAVLQELKLPGLLELAELPLARLVLVPICLARILAQQMEPKSAAAAPRLASYSQWLRRCHY
jgi:hypothetical protein